MGQTASLPQPGKTIQVIGAGLSRTGTASFSRALEILLEGPVYHCGTQSTIGPRQEIQTWIEILQHWLCATELAPTHATDPDRDRDRDQDPTPNPKPAQARSTMLNLLSTQLDGYIAITDMPGAQFLPELMQLCPTAKVICTIRDPIGWEKSFGQVVRIMGKWYLPWLLLPVPGMIQYFKYLRVVGRQWKRIYGEVPPTGKSYARHINWLREIVPEERLVFFDVRSGWEPLCRALGKEVPMGIPFPHVNDSEAFESVAMEYVRRGCVLWMGILGIVVGCVAILCCWGGLKL